MRTTIILTGLLLFAIFLYGQDQVALSKGLSSPIKIKWITNLKGDFTFKSKWSYPEGIYRNSYGQLSCDGFCPPGTEAMIDAKGRIIKDSLHAFYKLVDTSHQAYTISCQAWCYEWAGTHFIEVVRTPGDAIFCHTLENAATHCSLELTIANDYCDPVIDLNSIAKGGNSKFYCTSGYMTIDRQFWDRGILRASFSFSFKNTENPKKPIYWRGNIYSTIKSLVMQ